ncbi:outer membrane protein assembly factor [Thermoproteota archaeon]
MIRNLCLLLIAVCFYFSALQASEIQPLKLENLMDTLQKATQEQPADSTDMKKNVKQEEDLLEKIEIKGLKHTSEAVVLNELIFSPGSTVNHAKIQRVIKRIRSLDIFSGVTYELQPGKKGKILIISVQENPLIADIQFKGNYVVSDEELSAVIQSRKGDILNIAQVRKDIQAVETLYHEKGYFMARVYQVSVVKNEGDPLIFDIGEGIIEEIILTGNNKTKDYVILREMKLEPGMVAQDVLIKEDLRRVYNLNYFTELMPEFLPGDTQRHYKLRIRVTERETSAALTFGGGYSPTAGFSFFTDVYWDNLFGTGQLIMLKGQFGRATTYQFKYSSPWMWGERKSFSFRTWSTSGEIGTINPIGQQLSFRDEARVGLDATIGWPLSYEVRTAHRMKYESVVLRELKKDYTIQSYNFTISYDTRDIWFNPSKGDYYSFSVEKGFKLFKQSLEFTRFDILLRKFFPTFEKQTIATRLDLGYLKSPEINDTDKFLSEWYYVGGNTTVRGYDDQYPIGYGNKQVVASIEYRFLFNDTFQALIFVDAGYATLNSIADFTKYRIGKGVGVRINIPGLGPLRLDLGMDDQGVTRFHFNIGHIF